MLFEVTFSDNTVKTMQAHNRKQLEEALQNVKFIKPAKSQQKKQSK